MKQLSVNTHYKEWFRKCGLAFALISLALSSTILAQDASQPAPKPAGPVVELSLIVTDSAKTSLNKINKEEVHVFEDKAEQTVLSVERDERPVDCIVAIDSSGSFRTLLGTALASAKLLITNRRPEDEAQATPVSVKVAAVDNKEAIIEWFRLRKIDHDPFHSFIGSDEIRLALAAKIIEAHGGSAKLAEDRFVVQLPLSE